MVKKIKKLLMDLRIPPHLNGFDYIVFAINMIFNAEKKTTMEEIHLAISEEFNISPKAAERSMRFAISKMDKDSEFYQKFINGKASNTAYVLYSLKTYIEISEEGFNGSED